MAAIASAYTGSASLLVGPSGDATGAADYASITAAMTAAGAAGQTVQLRPGNYQLNKPLKWDTSAQSVIQLAPSLIGAPGMGGCSSDAGTAGVVQLTATSSFPAGEFLIDYIGPAPSGGAGGNTGFRVSGLVLQCNSKAAGVRSFNSEDSEWSYLVINDPAAPNPANTAGGPLGAVNFVSSPSFQAFNNRAQRVYVKGAAQHSFYLNEGTGSYVLATNCTSLNAGWSAFYVLNGATVLGGVAQGSGKNNPQSGYYHGEYQLGGATLAGCVAFNGNPKGPGLQLIGEPGVFNSVTGCTFLGSNTAISEQWSSLCMVVGGSNAHATTLLGCNLITGTHTSDFAWLDSSALGSVTFAGCQFSTAGGALSGTPYNLNGAAATVKFDSCAGINPAGTQTVAVPATTVATAALPVDATFYVTGAAGGSCTIAVGGGPTVTVPASTLIPVHVPAGKTVTPTYGAGNAPTWAVEGH
jgi:hypothetical protein